MTPSVITRSLGKRFGRKWALAHVDLEVAAGQGLLVVGDNGSGKTTLLRLLAGLLLPTLGEVEILGSSPQQPGSEARSHLSLVGHQGFLYEALTPLETLALWNRLGGRRKSVAELENLLAEAGLAADRDTRVSGFSSGMRKRLSLTRLHLENPRVVLLDEPFTALDQAGREWLLSTLSRLRADGAALIVASHDPQRAAPICDRAIRIERGQISWQGSLGDLESAS
ncbi:MAG: heme ABC exporter ATP-binding protein CcmA [Acidobacteria bacterium]|nr:heme ABC exporter ATP-binding protein CcmA [Acidobacteriota bacterium]